MPVSHAFLQIFIYLCALSRDPSPPQFGGDRLDRVANCTYGPQNLEILLDEHRRKLGNRHMLTAIAVINAGSSSSIDRTRRSTGAAWTEHHKPALTVRLGKLRFAQDKNLAPASRGFSCLPRTDSSDQVPSSRRRRTNNGVTNGRP